jgi:hypothetical protein
MNFQAGTKNPYGFTYVQESSAQRIDMTIPSFASLFMVHSFFVHDYGLLHI